MSALAPAELTAVSRASQKSEPTQPAKLREVLTYRVGDVEYGLDILAVQEIRSYEKSTRIANAPAHLLGVVNLRGTVIAIHDLRVLLGAGQAEFNANTVAVMLHTATGVVGCVVDSVNDVVSLSAADIRPTPLVNAHVEQFVEGIACLGEGSHRRTVVLLDVSGLLAAA